MPCLFYFYFVVVAIVSDDKIINTVALGLGMRISVCDMWNVAGLI